MKTTVRFRSFKRFIQYCREMTNKQLDYRMYGIGSKEEIEKLGTLKLEYNPGKYREKSHGKSKRK